MNRNGEIAVLGKGGREIERYPVVYGAVLKVQDGQEIQPNQILAEWDPFNIPILTEVAGDDQIRRHHRRRDHAGERDKVTGKISRVIVESRDLDARPRISIKDKEGGTAPVPERAGRGTLSPADRRHHHGERGGDVSPGTILAKIPRETTKTKDITGGLPRVAELFEVSKPKENAILTEIDGTVSFGQYTKGRRKVTITPEIGDPSITSFPRANM